MHDVLAVQRRQRRQAIANDGDGNARLQSRLHRTGRHDYLVDVRPPPLAHAPVNVLQHLPRQQPAQVVSVDPLHFHDADAVVLDPIVYVEKVVLLNLGDVGRHVGDPPHGVVIRSIVFVALGRKNLQRHRKREAIGAAPLAQIDDSLAARTKLPNELVMLRPTQPLLVNDLAVMRQKLLGAPLLSDVSCGSGKVSRVKRSR